MSLSLSPANQNAPRARAWWEKDCYKKANAWEISLFAARHGRRNIKIKSYTYTVTLSSARADLDAAFRATPTTRYYDFALPVARPAWDRQRTVSRLPHCNLLGPVACRALMCIRCHPSGTAPSKFWSLMSPFVWGRPATILNDVIYSTASTLSSKSSLAV